ITCSVFASLSGSTQKVKIHAIWLMLCRQSKEGGEVATHYLSDFLGREIAELVRHVLLWPGEPFTVREVGAEYDRSDTDLVDDATNVLLREGRDHEVVLKKLRWQD